MDQFISFDILFWLCKYIYMHSYGNIWIFHNRWFWRRKMTLELPSLCVHSPKKTTEILNFLHVSALKRVCKTTHIVHCIICTWSTYRTLSMGLWRPWAVAQNKGWLAFVGLREGNRGLICAEFSWATWALALSPQAADHSAQFRLKTLWRGRGRSVLYRVWE